MRAIAIAAVLCLAACYSTSYRKEAAANVALLSELADKLNDYCQAGFVVGDRPVSSEEMGEFDYALAKARAWAAMTQRSAGDRPSYRALAGLMGAYEAFVRDADQYRLAPLRDPARLAALAREHDAVAARARAVMDSLADEGR